MISKRDIAPHDLASVRVMLQARGVTLGRSVHFASETESTSDDAKRAAKAGCPHGELFVAELQTRGRGRHGRSWTSRRGEDLLFSVVLRLEVPAAPEADWEERRKGSAARLPLVALAAGLAVRDAVARSVPAAGIKWPNDVVVGDKKMAGVLVEGCGGALVVGVGLNVHSREHPPELRATSVALEGGDADRAALLVDILEGIDRDAPAVVSRGLGLLHARLAAADALAERAVTLEDGTRGVADGIDLEGRLVVRVGGETVRLVSPPMREDWASGSASRSRP